MIFDETQYYDQYEKNKLIKKSKKSSFVEFLARDSRFAYESLDSNNEN